jgi:hypothetical protein
MAISQCVCASFALECLQAIHDFPDDTLKVALYTSSATLDQDTTAYTTTGEASGTGYSAGGETLTFEEDTPKLVDGRVVVSFSDVTWSSLSATFRGALIYNSSKSNRACFVIDFGGNITRSGTDFVLPFPTVNSSTAFMRVIPSGVS